MSVYVHRGRLVRREPAGRRPQGAARVRGTSRRGSRACARRTRGCSAPRVFTSWRRDRARPAGRRPRPQVHSLDHVRRHARTWSSCNLDMHSRSTARHESAWRVCGRSPGRGRSLHGGGARLGGAPPRAPSPAAVADRQPGADSRHLPSDPRPHPRPGPRRPGARRPAPRAAATSADSPTTPTTPRSPSSPGARIAQWVDAAAADGGGTGLPHRRPTAATTTSGGRTICRRTPSAPKAALLDTYGGDPAWHCGDPQGCGDYAVGQGAVLRSPQGMGAQHPLPLPHLRAPGRCGPGTAGPPSTGCSAPGRSAGPGPRPAAGWSPPEDLGGGPLAPALSVVTDRRGHRLLFGLRFSGLDGAPAANTRDIVLLDSRTTPRRRPGGRAGWAASATPRPIPYAAGASVRRPP